MAKPTQEWADKNSGFENDDEPNSDQITESTPIIQNTNNDTRVKKGSNGYVYALTFFAALGGFLFGYDTGVISGALLPLKRRFKLNELWSELVVSVTVGGAIIGSISIGWLSDKFGRRIVLILASCIFAVGSVVMAVAQSKEILLVGRGIVGIAIGR